MKPGDRYILKKSGRYSYSPSTYREVIVLDTTADCVKFRYKWIPFYAKWQEKVNFDKASSFLCTGKKRWNPLTRLLFGKYKKMKKKCL